jgi:hypothetical protein
MGDRMSVQLPVVDFTTEQRVLWTRVHELWELTKKGDQGQIRSALHPHYVGWDMSAQIPHDREAAVLSESGNPPTLREYKLHPLSVQVYDGAVGVVHYSYSAVVGSGGHRAGAGHGEMGVARLRIHPGKLEEFRRLQALCLESVRTKDTGTLQYECFSVATMRNVWSSSDTATRRPAGALRESRGNGGCVF